MKTPQDANFFCEQVNWLLNQVQQGQSRKKRKRIKSKKKVINVVIVLVQEAINDKRFPH